MDPSDRHRLELFHDSGDQAAFASLVQQYLPLVHAVALRVTANPSHAQDLSQAVFVKLAQRPLGALRDIALPVWLHGETRSLSLALLRSEKRRRGREVIAASLHAMMSPDLSIPWEKISPLLDRIIAELPERERELILARYFQGRSHRSIASSLGLTEDASRMRVNRGLEKMRDLLAKRGITTTTAALASALPGHALAAASVPAGLAASITTAACSAGAPVSFLTLGFMSITKKATLVVGILLLAGLAGVVVHQNQQSGRRSSPTVTGDTGGDAELPAGRSGVTGAEALASKTGERVHQETSADWDWDKINADNAKACQVGALKDFEKRFAELVEKLDLTESQQAALHKRGGERLAAFDGYVAAADMEIVEGKTLAEMDAMVQKEKSGDADLALASLTDVLDRNQQQQFDALRKDEMAKRADVGSLYQISQILARDGAEDLSPEAKAAIRGILADGNLREIASGYSGGVRQAVGEALAQVRSGQGPPLESLDQAASIAVVQDAAHRLIDGKVAALKPYLSESQLEAYRSSVEQDFDLARMDAVKPK